MKSLALLFLVVTVTAVTGFVPPAGMNRYCGAKIFGSSANCNSLMQAGYATNGNSIVYTFYKTPALAPFHNGDVDLVLPTETWYSEIDGQPNSTYFAQPNRFPAVITIPVPYPAETAFAFVGGSDNLVVSQWDSTGTSFGPVAISPTPAGCLDTLFLYRRSPIPAARSTILFDMNPLQDSLATSFTNTAANQVQISPLVMPPTQDTVLNVTQAVVPAAYELLSRDGYINPDSGSSTYGTRAWVTFYGTGWTSTRNWGIPVSDIGSPSFFSGTVDIVVSASCQAILGDSFSVKATGLFNTSEGAAPVRLQWSETQEDAQRIVYAPAGVPTIVPRPTNSEPLTADVVLQPYCRQIQRGAVDPATQATLIAFMNNEYIPVSNIASGAIVYVLSASDLPGDDVGAYARVQFVNPLNSSQDELSDPIYLYNGYRRFYVPQYAGTTIYKVYLQAFTETAEWIEVANEVDISSIPYCACDPVSPYDLGYDGGLLLCDTLFATDINQTIPENSWPGTLTVTGTQPSCELYLTDGYLGDVAAVLQNGVYTASSWYIGADSFLWSVIGSAPGSVTFLNSTTGGSAVQFRVNTKLNSIQLNLQVSNTTASVTATANCTLNVATFTGAPLARILPLSVIMNLGDSPPVFDASSSISPTGEPLTYSWSRLAPPISVPNVATIAPTAGNTPSITVTPSVPGSFLFAVQVKNPRGFFSNQAASLYVLNGTTPVNATNLPSTCISNITNGNNLTYVAIPPFSDGQYIVSQPPQQDPLFFTPNQAGSPVDPYPFPPSSSTTPSGATPSGSNDGQDVVWLVLVLLCVVLGVPTLFIIFWVVRDLRQYALKNKRRSL